MRPFRKKESRVLRLGNGGREGEGGPSLGGGWQSKSMDLVQPDHDALHIVGVRSGVEGARNDHVVFVLNVGQREAPTMMPMLATGHHSTLAHGPTEGFHPDRIDNLETLRGTIGIFQQAAGAFKSHREIARRGIL